MKKLSTNPDSATSQSGNHKCASPVARVAVNQILKAAYRRHARGRVAQQAMVACLGR